MPLSEHDETQFRLLTADLTLGDATTLKKRRNKDREPIVRHVALPSLNALLWLIAIAVLVTFASGSAHNIPLFIVSSTISMVLFGFTMKRLEMDR